MLGQPLWHDRLWRHGELQAAGDRCMGAARYYELSPPAENGGAWTETILYSFPTAKQGYVPKGNLVFDKAGNLYGATMFGGGKGTSCDPYLRGPLRRSVRAESAEEKGRQVGGEGVARIRRSHGWGRSQRRAGLGRQGQRLRDDVHGRRPERGVRGRGVRYGFRLDPPTKTGGPWKEKIIHRFQGDQDGDNPRAGLVFGNGDPYGTTLTGGTTEEAARYSA